VGRTFKNIAIIGGGPGGLILAKLLDDFPGPFVRATIFEASPRLGGKVLTRSFGSAPAIFEAGVAELYDYSQLGQDPLKELVVELNLETIPMTGRTVILGEKIIANRAALKRHFGSRTATEASNFYRSCAGLYSPADYYMEDWQIDKNHAWADRLFSEVLNEIKDQIARNYVTVASRSDIATEPYLTSALNGLKNVLMDDERYIRLYSIKGGIGRLIDRLASEISAEVRLNSPVLKIGRTPRGTYCLTSRREHRMVSDEFDVVMLALPQYWLGQIEWDDPILRKCFQDHVANYDFPAHYLRISCLFERPFWRDKLTGSYFMHDAFGGCCVYDESARYPHGSYGVLGWLVAGNHALALSNFDDQRLLALALDSLPKSMAEHQNLFVEGEVHRWVGAVNARPGGKQLLEMRLRHSPDPVGNPYLFVIGDYLLDSTINGVVDSAEYASSALLSKIYREKHAGVRTVTGTVKTKKHKAAFQEYFDNYAGGREYDRSFKDYFCEKWTCDLIEAVWSRRPPYKLLDCGSANGLTLKAFAKMKVDAWGVENNEYIHSQTPIKWRSRNLRGDVRNLPFADASFDFVYETCLCYLPEESIDNAIRELYRICRIGVVFGSIATDMTPEIIVSEELFYGVETFASMQEWGGYFMRNEFQLAIQDPDVLRRVWKIEKKSNEGATPWYPDSETMRYCFYSKPNARGR
jgi:monoamine oxidase/ubiquinone/menaquinone biosynthesis C-methylase UbiE